MNTNPEPTPADVEAVAKAIERALNCDDLPEGGWPEICRQAAIAALSSLPSEREQIVAFMRQIDICSCSVPFVADQIEAGAHLPTTEQEEG